MAHVGPEPWPFSSQESTVTTEPADHWRNRLQSPLICKECVLHYVCILDALHLDYSGSDPGSCSCSVSVVIRRPAAVPRTWTELTQQAFLVASPHTWNSLPSDIRSCHAVYTFKWHLKTYLYSFNLKPPASVYPRNLRCCTVIIIVIIGWSGSGIRVIHVLYNNIDWIGELAVLLHAFYWGSGLYGGASVFFWYWVMPFICIILNANRLLKTTNHLVCWKTDMNIACWLTITWWQVFGEGHFSVLFLYVKYDIFHHIICRLIFNFDPLIAVCVESTEVYWFSQNICIARHDVNSFFGITMSRFWSGGFKTRRQTKQNLERSCGQSLSDLTSKQRGSCEPQ